MAAVQSCCSSCLRALRLQTRRQPSSSSSRHLTSISKPSIRISTHRPSQSPIVHSKRKQARPYASTATPTTHPQPQPQPSTQPSREPAEPYKPSGSEATHAQAITSILFKECARQADYTIPQVFEAKGSTPKTAAGEDVGRGSGFWYESWGLSLHPTFNTWAQITFLHMWLVVVRLRALERARSALWQQKLTDHFFWEAEHRMSLFHKISSAAIRQRYLKDVYNQWRGVQGAYDEGLIRGDAVLGAAVWRNVFRAGQGAGGVGVGIGSGAEAEAGAENDGGVVDRGTSGSPGAGQLSRGDETGAAATAQDIVEGDPRRLSGAIREVAELTQAEEEEAAFDWRRVACIVAFMRRGLSRLDAAPDSVVLEGRIRFGDPLKEWQSVTGSQSVGLSARFGQADDQALEQWNKGELEV